MPVRLSTQNIVKWFSTTVETGCTFHVCRNLVIQDPVTQRATLNADLLIALLTQGKYPEYGGGSRGPRVTSANLLPPDGMLYAQVHHCEPHTHPSIYSSKYPSILPFIHPVSFHPLIHPSIFISVFDSILYFLFLVLFPCSSFFTFLGISQDHKIWTLQTLSSL